MKRICNSLFLALLLVIGVFNINSFAIDTPQNVQAAWMTTAFNLDFPSTKNSITAQQSEFTSKLDKLKAMGINTIIVQVRPKGDALYKSSINPWSDVLTGVQGKDPGYDPMAFMIQEAHSRGMAFHAWLNPYRITTSGTNVNALAATHPARLHPDWVIKYNNAMYYNPDKEGVKNHIVSTVQEIVKNYDVDAIDFDDYFYPSGYPLPKGENKNGTVANSRRQNINNMVQRVSSAIKNIKSNVLFGISPAGVWKNSKSDPTGSNTTGSESYYSVYADTRTWIKNGWIDFVAPQIYWEIGNKAADYETLVKWWSSEVKGTNVKLYISQGVYKDTVAKQIDKELAINQKYPQVSGSFYYSLKSLLSDGTGCKAKVTAFIQQLPQQTNTTGSAIVIKSNLKTGVVTAKTLNVRSGAGLTYSVVTKASSGTKVNVINTKSGWLNIKLPNGKTGWVSIDYVRLDKQSTPQDITKAIPKAKEASKILTGDNTSQGQAN